MSLVIGDRGLGGGGVGVGGVGKGGSHKDKQPYQFNFQPLVGLRAL